MTVSCLRGHQLWVAWSPLTEHESAPGAVPQQTAVWCDCHIATGSAHPGGEPDRAKALVEVGSPVAGEQRSSDRASRSRHAVAGYRTANGGGAA